MRVSSEGELQLAADSAAAPKEMRVALCSPATLSHTVNRQRGLHARRLWLLLTWPSPSSQVRAVASYPSPGKLLLFNGKLLHGCPPQLSQPQSTSEPRLTLLINIWLNHRPIDIPRLPRFAWRLLRCVAPIPSRGRTATKSRGEFSCSVTKRAGAGSGYYCTTLLTASSSSEFWSSPPESSII